MWGGEERTDKRFMAKGTILFHNSNKKIKYFEEKGFPEATCFFTSDRGNGKFRYQVTTGVDRNVSYFGEEEVRFDLRKSDTIIEIGTDRVVAILD